MHYLEDYLEVIEFLPGELKTRVYQIRELDDKVQRQLESLEDRSKTFFTLSRKNKEEWREGQFNSLCHEYDRAIEASKEKVHLANQIHELVERYQKRLDHDLNHFTLELEADTAGITEILEQKSYQLDRPLSPERPQIIPKRRQTHHDDLLDHDDYSPSPVLRSSPVHSRLPQYSRRDRRPTLPLTFSSEPDPDIFDFDDQLGSPADIYAGFGGKPSLTLIGDTRPQRKKQHSAMLTETIQDDLLGYVDPNEPRYCLCNQVSYGEMICCDNPSCSIEWFHYGCVGITEAPKGKWYCPQCVAQLKKRNRR